MPLIRPSKIRLDLCTICELKCPSCLTAQGAIAKTLGSQFLLFEDFKRFVDANPSIARIETSSNGEIFSNPDLLRIMEYAYQKKIILTALNGVHFNKVSLEVLEGLVKYQFDFISCSIDGSSPETYKIYRVGGDFNQVIANIRKLNKLKAKYRSTVPGLRWQFVVFGHNEHEIPRAREMAKELGMEFLTKTAYGDFSSVKNQAVVKKELKTDAAYREKFYTKYGRFYQGACSQLWEEPQINSDGRVLGCSQNRRGGYGNVFEEGFINVLNNEKMNYAREMVLGKKEAREDIFCVRCGDYKKMSKNNIWIALPRALLEVKAGGVDSLPGHCAKIFSYIYRDCDLLSHFFAHYDALGIKGYYFIVNTWGKEGLREDVEMLCRGRNYVLRFVHKPFVDKERDEALEDMKNKYSLWNEWVMAVDLDEFVEFPVSLEAVVFFHKLMGYDSVCGVFADRIHRDGLLPKLDLQRPIEEQYPLGSDLTRNILLGWAHKVVLMKACAKFQNCGHSTGHKKWDGVMHAVIHHYKWSGVVLERLTERVESFKALNMNWWRESQRFLDFYESRNRIDLQAPGLNAREMASFKKGLWVDVAGVSVLVLTDIYKKAVLSVLRALIKAMQGLVALQLKGRSLLKGKV